MQIWVDADGCPGSIRDILIRAARRARTHMTLVANHPLPAPASAFIRGLQVHPDFDIAGLASTGDLVVTADMQLAPRSLPPLAHRDCHRFAAELNDLLGRESSGCDDASRQQ